MRLLISLLLACPVLIATVTDVSVKWTSTQAVIFYTAPNDSACTLAVSESSSLSPLVHDVNPALFNGSDLDSRPGSVSEGRQRVVVVGKRVAEQAADGKFYSRALQAATMHWLRIQCGASVHNSTFRTQTIPLGDTYNDPLPSAGNGEYAWPTVNWLDRTQRVIDPLTGALLKRLTLPSDMIEPFSNQSVGTVPAAPGWTSPDAARVDDALAATYDGTNRDRLFVPANISVYQGGYHNRDARSVNYMTVEMNAWCGTGCSSASAEDRKIEICLSADGVTCGSGLIERTLNSCTSSCTGSSNRFVLADTTAVLAAWGGDPAFDITDVHKRSGNVSTAGTTVNWLGGNYFSIRWNAGSKITINGVEYTIASVDSERRLTLTASAGTQGNVGYTSSNFGFLIRKKTTGAQQINLQWLRHSYAFGEPAAWDTAGDIEANVSCSAVKVAGPGGEQGYHCVVGRSIFWLGADSGTASRIGKVTLPGRSGTDGWNYVFQCAPMWDPNDGNRFYCEASNASGNKVIVQAIYNGSNVDQPSTLSIYDALVECGSAPCWTLSNLTPQSTGTLTNKLTAFSSDCSSTNPLLTQWGMYGIQGRYLLLTVTTAATNDVLGCHVVFDTTTQTVVAARPSWKYFPTRWSVLHGPATIGYESLVFFPNQAAIGAWSGGDTTGRGPWRTQIKSGAIPASGSACPSRPGDSPISAADWPVGNNCITVTVNGEPCDPSPGANEPSNPSKCGAAGSAYLQDAEVRDVFCIQADAYNGCGLYFGTEFVRLLIKSGNTWTLQRKVGTAGVLLASAADSYLVTMPPTCALNAVYPCGQSASIWNHQADPQGRQSSSMAWDRIGNGTGHASIRPGGIVWSTVQAAGPLIDGQEYGFYDVRAMSLPEAYNALSYRGPANPPFAGRTGIGQPNEVDGHPSQPHYRANTKSFFDGRPYLGRDDVTGNSSSPGSVVTGSLYRFTAVQMKRLRRKTMPTLAACGPHVLSDISSATQGDVIGGSATDAYKYCVALRAGECRAGSQAGDVYANCPRVAFPYSLYLGAGSEDVDRRDIAITDNGSFTNSIQQGFFEKPDAEGRFSRRITYALSRYRYVNPFWNVKSLPLGEWLLVVSPWMRGQRSEAWLVKYPPVEQDSEVRNTFRAVPVEAREAPPGADRMVVFYGYDSSLRCSSRNETCVAASSAVVDSNPSPFLYESELVNSSGAASVGGSFLVRIPGLSNRVLYYRIGWRNSSSGQTISRGALQVEVLK